jgi:Cu-processing system permease protein
MRTLVTLIRKELRDARRNRWLMLYAISFAVLALAFSSAALLGSGRDGFANFGRTAASLINLVLLVVPLMGLLAGAQSIVAERERGTLPYLLAQPLSRAELFVAKFIGQALALAASLLLGFALCFGVLLSQGDGSQAGVLAGLAVLAVLLSTASLSLGMALSSICRSSAAALGSAVFLWLLLAFGGDLGLMGLSTMAGMPIGTVFSISLVNPLAVFRMAAVLTMRSSLEILGPAGLYAVRTYGALLMPLFATAMLAWVVVPATCAMACFQRRDAV